MFDAVQRIDELDLGTLYYKDDKGQFVMVAEEYSLEVKNILSKAHREYKKTLGFVSVYQSQELDVARDLTPAAIKVLSILRGKLQFGNKVYGLSNRFIAEWIKLSERTVSRAIKELETYGILKVQGKKHNRVFCISPANTSKGSINNNRKMIRNFRK